MKKVMLLPLLLDVCFIIGLLALCGCYDSSGSRYDSNTSDAFEDAIEDNMHEDIQAEDILVEDTPVEDIQPEDVEAEPTGGTWTDPGSGLTWQNPRAESTMPWQDAMDYCENLTLDGHGDWRLPTISELRSLIRGCPATQTGGSCGVDDVCLSASCWSDCTGCLIDGGPDEGCYWPVEVNGGCFYYWSSSSCEDYVSRAWHVSFHNGSVGYGYKGIYNAVRCVR